MTLADIAFFVALVTLNGLGVSGRISTAEVKTNFLKPNKDSDLYAKARVIKNGKKIVFGDVTTINGRDETIAHSTVTYFRTQVTFP